MSRENSKSFDDSNSNINERAERTDEEFNPKEEMKGEIKEETKEPIPDMKRNVDDTGDDPQKLFKSENTIDRLNNEFEDAVGGYMQNQDGYTDSSIQMAEKVNSLGMNSNKKSSKIFPQRSPESFQGVAAATRKMAKKSKMGIKKATAKFKSKKVSKKRAFDIDDMLLEEEDHVAPLPDLEQIDEMDDEDHNFGGRQASMKVDDFKSKFKKRGISKMKVKKLQTRDVKPNYIPNRRKERIDFPDEDLGKSGFYKQQISKDSESASNISDPLPPKRPRFPLDRKQTLVGKMTQNHASATQKPKKKLIKGLVNQVFEKMNDPAYEEHSANIEAPTDSYDDLKFG